jgi:hypothetical protein
VSTEPAVIAALVTLGEATLDGDDWQVIDGPVAAVTTAIPRVLLVADEELVSASEFDNLAASGVDDQYVVPLLISVALPGADSLTTARAEALAAYEAIRDATLAPALGRNLGLGAQGVMQAYVTGERRTRQYATPTGRACDVRFYARVRAQLT